eukprot:2163259-Rhodomonas_salina.2
MRCAASISGCGASMSGCGASVNGYCARAFHVCREQGGGGETQDSTPPQTQRLRHGTARAMLY